MILAFDSYYFENKAKTVCITFDNWTDDHAKSIEFEVTNGISDYESGAFYKRELPCILSMLRKIDLNEIELIIIDGYVILDDGGKLGLGGHLFEHLDEKIPVIGVAKTRFNSNKLNVQELYRGESKNPLFISAKGIELDKAANYIKSMHGNYRIPTLLKLLDMKTKEDV